MDRLIPKSLDIYDIPERPLRFSPSDDPNDFAEEDLDFNFFNNIDANEIDASGLNLYSGELGLFLADKIKDKSIASYSVVNLSKTTPSIPVFRELIQSFRNITHLDTLLLNNNQFPKEAGTVLASLLTSTGLKLRCLYLRDNNIGDQGVAALGKSFSTDISEIKFTIPIPLLSLQVLDLSGNGCGDAGVLSLCRGLVGLSKHACACNRTVSLKVLRLNKNSLGMTIIFPKKF